MDRSENKIDHSGYFTLPQSKSKARELSQPVRIGQLLRSCGRYGPQSGENNSTIKLSQPERIPFHLRSKSSQKKKETNTYMKYDKQNVRRTLNFTRTPTFIMKTKEFTRTSRNDLNDNPAAKKENTCLSVRRSSLLMPNTIKNLYIKNRVRQSKSILPQHHILTTNFDNKYPRISEGLENDSALVTDTNAFVDPAMHEKSNKTSVIEHIPSRTLNVNVQSNSNSSASCHSDLNYALEKDIPENLNSNEISNVNVQNSQTINYNVTSNGLQLSTIRYVNMEVNTGLHNNDANRHPHNYQCADSFVHSFMTCTPLDAEKIKDMACSNNIEKKKCSSMSVNDSKDTLPTSQLVNIKNNLCRHLRLNTNEHHKYVNVSEAELMDLATTLEYLICRFEEDMSSLKSTLTVVKNILSAVNMTDKLTENNEIKKKQMTENINNTEIRKYVNINTENNVRKEASETLDMSSLKISKTEISGKSNSEKLSSPPIELSFESNKENEIFKFPNDMKYSEPKFKTSSTNNSDVTDNSFVDLENELGIINIESKMMNVSLQNCTPVRDKYKDNKIGRPLKEYMVLRSRMSCLMTPDVKRFQSSDLKNMGPANNSIKASLSNKVLAELQNLYADSPDTR